MRLSQIVHHINEMISMKKTYYDVIFPFPGFY